MYSINPSRDKPGARGPDSRPLSNSPSVHRRAPVPAQLVPSTPVQQVLTTQSKGLSLVSSLSLSVSVVVLVVVYVVGRWSLWVAERRSAWPLVP